MTLVWIIGGIWVGMALLSGVFWWWCLRDVAEVDENGNLVPKKDKK